MKHKLTAIGGTGGSIAFPVSYEEPGKPIRNAIDRAVAAERERCAKIAEGFSEGTEPPSSVGAICSYIAREINGPVKADAKEAHSCGQTKDILWQHAGYPEKSTGERLYVPVNITGFTEMQPSGDPGRQCAARYVLDLNEQGSSQIRAYISLVCNGVDEGRVEAQKRDLVFALIKLGDAMGFDWCASYRGQGRV